MMVQLQNFSFFITFMVVLRGTAAPVLLKWFVSRDVSTGAPFFNGTIIPILISSFLLLVYLHSRKFIRSTDGAKSGVLVRANRPILLPDIMGRSSSETRARNALFRFVPVLHFLLLESKGDFSYLESFCGVLRLLFFRTLFSLPRDRSAKRERARRRNKVPSPKRATVAKWAPILSKYKHRITCAPLSATWRKWETRVLALFILLYLTLFLAKVVVLTYFPSLVPLQVMYFLPLHEVDTTLRLSRPEPDALSWQLAISLPEGVDAPPALRYHVELMVHELFYWGREPVPTDTTIYRHAVDQLALRSEYSVGYARAVLDKIEYLQWRYVFVEDGIIHRFPFRLRYELHEVVWLFAEYLDDLRSGRWNEGDYSVYRAWRGGGWG